MAEAGDRWSGGAGGADPECPAMDTSGLDAENPWPGLASFCEGAQAFFYGRDAEVEELGRLVRRGVLTLFYGKSGMGKSSLLQAGLFPRLRAEDHLPVYLRLDYAPAAAPPAAQVVAAMEKSFATAGVDALGYAESGATNLWEYFHLDKVDFWSRRNRLVTPVFIFDQFEEIFTLGARGAGAGSATEDGRDTFLREIEALVNNRAPPETLARMEADPAFAEAFDLRSQPYKVMLTLREDFLPELEGMHHHFRSLGHSRLRLEPLRGTQALEVVTRPGARLVDGQVARDIVHFVGSERRLRLFAGEDEDPLDRIEVEPALLSVVCRELNNQRLALGHTQITADLLSRSQQDILNSFYEDALEGARPGLRDFVEEELLTRSGFRDRAALEDALENPGVTREGIEDLVDRRLLRLEEAAGTVWVEVTHDVLAPVISASRERRREARRWAERAAARRRLWRGMARWVRGAAALAVLLFLLHLREDDPALHQEVTLEEYDPLPEDAWRSYRTLLWLTREAEESRLGEIYEVERQGVHRASAQGTGPPWRRGGRAGPRRRRSAEVVRALWEAHATAHEFLHRVSAFDRLADRQEGFRSPRLEMSAVQAISRLYQERALLDAQEGDPAAGVERLLPLLGFALKLERSARQPTNIAAARVVFIDCAGTLHRLLDQEVPPAAAARALEVMGEPVDTVDRVMRPATRTYLALAEEIAREDLFVDLLRSRFRRRARGLTLIPGADRLRDPVWAPAVTPWIEWAGGFLLNGNRSLNLVHEWLQLTRSKLAEAERGDSLDPARGSAMEEELAFVLGAGQSVKNVLGYKLLKDQFNGVIATGIKIAQLESALRARLEGFTGADGDREDK